MAGAGGAVLEGGNAGVRRRGAGGTGGELRKALPVYMDRL
jgi:hypothetical protein